MTPAMHCTHCSPKRRRHDSPQRCSSVQLSARPPMIDIDETALEVDRPPTKREQLAEPKAAEGCRGEYGLVGVVGRGCEERVDLGRLESASQGWGSDIIFCSRTTGDSTQPLTAKQGEPWIRRCSTRRLPSRGRWCS
jgi:hypothetical protein